MISFIINGKVKAKQSVKFTRNGHRYTPHEMVEYANYVKLCFMQKYPNFKPLECAIKMQMEVYISIPKSFSKKKWQQAVDGNLKPTVKPDCDNISKNLCDSLNGLAYKDDKQICELQVTKSYAEDDYVVISIDKI